MGKECCEAGCANDATWAYNTEEQAVFSLSDLHPSAF